MLIIFFLLQNIYIDCVLILD